MFRGLASILGNAYDIKVFGSQQADETVAFLDAVNGQVIQRCEGHADWVFSLSWSPSGRLLASGSDDKTVRLWESDSGICARVLEGHESEVRVVAFSPCGERLVSASSDDFMLHLWDTDNWTERSHWCSHGDGEDKAKNGVLIAAAWSPDGTSLASAESVELEDDKVQLIIRVRDIVMALERRTWRLEAIENKPLFCFGLAWSPRGDLLAAAVFSEEYDSETEEQHFAIQQQCGVYLWQTRSGELLEQFILPGAEDCRDWFFNCPFRLAWSADGGFLAAAYFNDRYVLWDTRRFMPLAAAEKNQADAGSLPLSLRHLPAALAHLHRLQIYPPLNLLRDVLALLGGEDLKNLAGLTGTEEKRSPDHPADPKRREKDRISPEQDSGEIFPKLLEPLRKLKWPPAARIGLAALVLRGYSSRDEWRPPMPVTSAQLRRQLIQALVGREIPAEPASFSLNRLREQARIIDKTLVGLLKLLGPNAVAEEPGLPLYFIHRLPRIHPHIQLDRRLLSLVPDSRESGQAQQRLPGGERSGLSLRGELPHLLPSQLLLPRELLHSRYLRGELLYRVYSGKEQPRLRPTLIILDVSPPCFGPVEKITRRAAFMLADALYHAQQPVMLLAAGGNNSVYLMEKPSDLLEIWTASTLQPVHAGRTLRAARMLSASLRENSLEPLLLLFSHVYFAADETDMPVKLPRLRGLFVNYPGQKNNRPAWAEQCERWETINASQANSLPEVLMRLIQ
ncbi:MAG: hypothetical protein GY862_33010 [Gammaproteobacteria bacterium]|nr:hypothetical protein [Gammaproteobacteria bacterium]